MGTDVEAPGDSLETVAAPTEAQREGDCDHLRPAPPGDAIEIADQVREQVVGEQFPDDQFHERTRPRQMPCACSKNRKARGRCSSRHRSASRCCLARAASSR